MLRRIVQWSASILGAGILALLLVLVTGIADPFIKSRILTITKSKIEALTPLKVKVLRWDGSLLNLVSGKIPKIRAALLTPLGPEVILESSVRWSRVKGFRIFQVEANTGLSGKLGQSTSTTIPLQLKLDFDRTSLLITDFNLKGEIPKFAWPAYGIDASGIHLDLRWLQADALIQGKLYVNEWVQKKDEEHAVQISDFQFTLEEKNQSGGSLALTVGSTDILWGEDYYEIPSKEFPLHAHWTEQRNKGEMSLGSNPKEKISLSVLRRSGLLSGGWNLNLEKAPDFALKLYQALGKSWPEELIWKSGSLKFHGKYSLPESKAKSLFSEFKISPDIEFSMDGGAENVSIFSRSGLWFLENLSVKEKIRLQEGGSLTLSFQDAGIKHLRFALKKTTWKLVRKGEGFQIIPLHALPLKLRSIPLDLGPLTGMASMEDAQFRVPLKIPPTSLTILGAQFCISPDRIPPGTVMVQVPAVKFSPRSFEMNPGTLRLKSFGGKLEINSFRLNEWKVGIPKFETNLLWSGIRLDELGTWSQFGRMDGTVEGYVKDLTLISWLPVNFRFLVQVKPFRDQNIIFSPEAMKNFTSLFAGQDLNEYLPGVVDFLAFGWVSRLFGGYDVQYVGLSGYTHKGSIVLETLDPPEILKYERNHFILYGPRFKMPIQSSRYPVVLDAPRLSNWVRQMIAVMKNLKLNSEENKEKQNEPEEESKPCIPEHPFFKASE